MNTALVIEWFWALLVRPDEDEADYPFRKARFAGAPGLADRIERFWDDGDREYIELVVLARRAGCLWEMDPRKVLAGLRAVVATGDGSESLDSESPADERLILRRLTRLAEDPDLAEAWLALISDTAAAVQAGWELDGRLTAETEARALAPMAARATGWPVVTPESNSNWSEKLPRLAEHAVSVGGEVIVVPAYLARKCVLLSFGDLVLVGTAANAAVLPSSATRNAARRLRALADPTRLALVEQLAIRPRGVGELARVMHLSQPTVSNHVRLLRDAGLVHEGERPRQRDLVVDVAGVSQLLDDVRNLVSGPRV